jgi:hypothetical protein
MRPGSHNLGASHAQIQGTARFSPRAGAILIAMATISALQRPAELAALAAMQGQLVGRAQLRAHGFDSDAVRRRITAGRWQPLGNAVVLHTGPVTGCERQWAAVLNVSGRAVIAGRVAAESHGLRGFPDTVIDVVTTIGARPIAIDGVRWRRTTYLDDFDVDHVLSPPTIRRDRAFISAASWTASPRVACGLLAATVQQRLTSATILRRVLLAAGDVRHRHHLLAVLADIEGGADSLSEIDLVRLARRAGLPPPIRQAFRLDASGRQRYLDADFGTFSVEVDGGVHLRPLNYWDDARRQNDLVLGGDRILRFPSIALRLEPEVVIAQLRAADAAFGRLLVTRAR